MSTETRLLAYAPRLRKIVPALVLPFLMSVVAYAAQQRPSAERVLADAKSAAVEQHKDIFLVFGASWCQPCHELEAFVADRKIRPILGKYFVIADLSVEEEHGKHPELNSPGAEKLLEDFGNKDGGVPFIVFLDQQGQLLINSNRPSMGKDKGGNVGYPAAPEEIDWFMQMLRKTLPSLSESDAHTIETWLRRASPR
jgi:thioredoxin-related protein